MEYINRKLFAVSDMPSGMTGKRVLIQTRAKSSVRNLKKTKNIKGLDKIEDNFFRQFLFNSVIFIKATHFTHFDNDIGSKSWSSFIKCSKNTH